MSIASLSELLEGTQEPNAIERELGLLAKTLGLFHQHARKAALMQRRSRSTGSRMGENDAWIATTATLAQLKLIGDDDDAFAGRPGVAYANFRTSAP